MKRTLTLLCLLFCSLTVWTQLTEDIDLELSFSTTTLQPDIYSYVSLEITVSNASENEATGVIINYVAPDGTVPEGGNEWSATQGNLNGSNWEVGTIAPFEAKTLTVNFFTLSEAPASAFAQVSAANESDVDSSPGNGNPFTANEDDELVVDYNGGLNPSCSITANWAYPTCDNNGTPNDPSDDVIYAAIRVLGTNTSASWTAEFNGETLIGNYNVTYQIGPYPYDSQNTVFTISDAQDSNCSTEVSIPAPVGGTCSNGAGGLTCENNPIQNPGFEANLAAWLIYDGTESMIELVSDANSGSTALLMETTASTGTISMGNRFLITNSSSQYRVSFYAKKELVDGPLFPASAYVRLFYYDINNVIIGNEFIANIHASEYSEYTGIFSVPEETQSIRVQATLFSSGDFGNGKLYIDDFCFQPAEQNEVLSINCPESNTIVVPFDVLGLWPISFDEPTASTTCPDGIVSIVQTEGPVSGTSVPTGPVYTISYEITDNCGNVETCSFEVDFENAPPPVNLQCPDDIEVNLEPGQTSVAVFWEEDDFSIDPPCVINGLVQTGGGGNGTDFEAGVYFIEYDVLGNCLAVGFTESCSFVVTVNEGMNSDQIDLELNLSQLNDAPDQYSNYSVQATLTNSSTTLATGVVVSFPKPAGVVYVGADPFSLDQGSFSAFGNEEWFIGNLEGGESVSLVVNYFLLAEEAPVAYAQVETANEEDTDSTPGNGVYPLVVEDDEANTDAPMILLPDLELDARIEQTGNYGQSRQFNVYLTLENNGFALASGVSVEVVTFGLGASYTQPFNFEMDQGTFNPQDNIWTVGEMAVGQEITLKIPMTLGLGDPIVSFSAQVKTQNEPDLDSVPGNGFTSEDDEVNVPGRPCELAVEILDIQCIDDPNFDGFSQLDEFIFDIAVTGAPEGWDIFFELYTPDNNSGDGDGNFSIGPVPRYMTSVGSTIYDRGAPGCKTTFANFDVVEGFDCESNELPDLRIVSIELLTTNPVAGSSIDLVVGIENLGGNIASEAEVALFLEDAGGIFSIGAIPPREYFPGQTAYVEYSFDIPCQVDPGNYNFYAIADNGNNVAELDETNNTFSDAAVINVQACGGTPCDEIEIGIYPSSISIGNTNSAHYIRKIFSPTWETVLDCIDDECDEPSILNNLAPGTYFVSIKLMDENWTTICDKDEYVEVLPGSSITAFTQRDFPSRPIQLKAIVPNPTMNDRVEVMIYSKQEGPQQIQCYNALGLLEKSFEIHLLEGMNQIPLDISKLTAGTYVLQMPGQNWRQMPVRMVVLRD